MWKRLRSSVSSDTLVECDRMNVREPTIRVAEGRDVSAVAQIYVSSWNAGFTGLMPQRQLDANLVARW